LGLLDRLKKVEAFFPPGVAN